MFRNRANSLSRPSSQPPSSELSPLTCALTLHPNHALMRANPCASIAPLRRADQGFFDSPSPRSVGPRVGPRSPSKPTSHQARPAPVVVPADLLPVTQLVTSTRRTAMKIYPTRDIRNVGFVGHGGTGKTQLVSSLLYTAGMTPRWGKVAEGSTTTDWDEEEIQRNISIQTGLAYAEWPCTLCSGANVKINFLDLPGYSTFITETKASLVAADAALIAVDAHVGSQVTTEKVWDYCTEYDIPRAFVLTWMDRELSSFERSMESLE